MTDITTPEKRSRMMAAIQGKDTRPELLVRRFLHSAGFRFRLHRRDLPGTPDIVLPRFRTAIFVHGCFWHRHEGCRYATTPATRKDFWQRKFTGNLARDHRNAQALLLACWKVVIVWECAMKHEREQNLEHLIEVLRSTDRPGSPIEIGLPIRKPEP